VGPEALCDTFSGGRVYVDARGRLSLCCQLSEYGDNARDVVADLNETPFREAWPRYVQALEAQHRRSAPGAGGADGFDAFPCIRCARSLGKMDWIRRFPASPWAGAAPDHAAAAPPLVPLTYRATSLQAV
jgi:hypothetical protein